ncbi:MAG: glutamine amidotransferase [Alphaproteobacteria bacterium]|nr:glutamine amidotransferase [Alphaproteobacteria bacterium]MDE2494649.1 glutamine amidotransferase [Alphaproteobacteria bacterium]
MKSALAIRHVHFEDLGAFGPVLEGAGYAVGYCQAGVDSIAQSGAGNADVLIVLGAPIGAYEEDKYPFLLDTMRVLEARLAAGRPTAGICLGAQLMARVLGARVYPGPAKEIGWAPVSLTQEGQNGPLRHLEDKPVLHWHGDTFDLPHGTTRLASTALTPNQAFSYGPDVLGIQFHPEALGGNFELWLLGHACEIAGVAGLSAGALREDACRYTQAASQAGAALFSEFLVGLSRT